MAHSIWARTRLDIETRRAQIAVCDDSRPDGRGATVERMTELLRLATATGPLDAVVTVPGSKSIANRALVCAALADGDIRLHRVPGGDDTVAMVRCLQALGAGVSDRTATRPGSPAPAGASPPGRSGSTPPWPARRRGSSRPWPPSLRAR